MQRACRSPIGCICHGSRLSDAARRRKAGVPKTIKFASKTQIALAQIEAACAAGIARGVVLMDHGYGSSLELRTGVSALGLSYVASINPQTSVWAPGVEPLPPKVWSGGGGKPSKRLRRDGQHRPRSVKQLALSLPHKAWRTIRWREGTSDWLRSRFARVRVRPARGDDRMAERRPEEWLLIEWPPGESEPTIIGCPICRLMSDSNVWSTSVNYAGGSSAIIRSSSKKPASGTTRDADGAAPPSRHTVHRHLRIPRSARGRQFPLGSSAAAFLSQPRVPAGYKPRGSAIAA